MPHLLCFGCDVHLLKHNGHDLAVWSIMQGSHMRGCDSAKEAMRMSLYKDQTTPAWGREHWRDDLETWHFSTQGPWRFRWVPGQRGVWIFCNEYSDYAMCHIPIPPDQASTKENAVEVAKAWVRGHHGWGTPAWDAIYARLMKGAVPHVSAQEHMARTEARRKPVKNRVAGKGSIHDGGIDIVAALCSVDKRTAETILRRYWPEMHVDKAVQEIAMALATGTLTVADQPITVTSHLEPRHEHLERSGTDALEGGIFDA